MIYYALYPVVAGELSLDTKYYTGGAPSSISELHCTIDDGIADDIAKVKEYLVTVGLAANIISNRLSGCSIGEVNIAKQQSQSWRWLKISGEALTDDFGIDCERRLVVSEKALSVIKTFKIAHADLFPIEEAPTLERRQNDIMNQMKTFAAKELAQREKH